MKQITNIDTQVAPKGLHCDAMYSNTDSSFDGHEFDKAGIRPNYNTQDALNKDFSASGFDDYGNADGQKQLTHTIDDIRGYSTIKIDNNPSAVISALNKNGYNIPVNANKNVLGDTLLSIYKNNKSKYLSILATVPFNQSANNYTTNPIFQQKVTNALNQLKS